MQVKPEWTMTDFSNMNWHDCRIYSISFPNEQVELTFDLDYVWGCDDRNEKCWVSKCLLTFSNVSNLKIDLDFNNTVAIDIVNLSLHNRRLSPNEKFDEWDFLLETDKGFISFSSTGYSQILTSPPVLSLTYDLGR